MRESYLTEFPGYYKIAITGCRRRDRAISCAAPSRRSPTASPGPCRPPVDDPATLGQIEGAEGAWRGGRVSNRGGRGGTFFVKTTPYAKYQRGAQIPFVSQILPDAVVRQRPRNDRPKASDFLLCGPAGLVALDLCHIAGNPPLRLDHVMSVLQAKEVACGQAEELAQAQIGVRGDVARAVDDCMDTITRHTDRVSQPVLAYADLIEKLFLSEFRRGVDCEGVPCLSSSELPCAQW
jgi:hypothetical protein